ncbi:cell wall-binding repeat-containing protein [Herbiconiux sp. P17]|uniref:cell wall-binding repeat-containing protein n=1 Tax=Herbiconiux wuyangfengii TaxID=3342794 RepID=UPI0035B98B35
MGARVGAAQGRALPRMTAAVSVVVAAMALVLTGASAPVSADVPDPLAPVAPVAATLAPTNEEPPSQFDEGPPSTPADEPVEAHLDPSAAQVSDPPATALSADSSTPIAVGAPWYQLLDASWTWENAEPLPSTTRLLSVTIPPELFDFESTITAEIVGAQRDPVSVVSADATTRVVTVSIPEGYLATAAPSMTSGSPRFSLALSTTRPQPDGVVAAPYAVSGDRLSNYSLWRGYFSYGYVSVGFDLGPPGATEHARTVERDDALRYDYRRSYWIPSGSGIAVAGGESITVTGAPALASAVPLDIIMNGWHAVTAWSATPLGADIAIQVPDRAAVERLPGEPLTLTASYRDGTDRVDVGLGVAYVHDASSGPGETTRVAGDDRYFGAIGISQQVFADQMWAEPTVLVTSGEKFADSLSAAAATAHIGGSLLLAPPGSAEDVGWYDRSIGYEAWRVGAPGLVIVGGGASVADESGARIADSALVPAPERIGGQDRFEVSRNTALRFWPSGASTVFVATGLTFPDALSAVPAAASQQAPVLLVPGTQKAVDQSTLATLASLKTQRIVIVGGPASVSPEIEKQLAASVSGGVERVSGADRYEVSTAVNTKFFPKAEEAFVATGMTFPDALSGGVLAASRKAPLLLVRPDCVPKSAHAALTRWGVSRTTLLGGTASLGKPIENLVPCR